MWRVLVCVFVLALGLPARAAADTVSLPLSKSAEGTIGFAYVCRADGMIGPLVDTSRVGGGTLEAVALFSGLDVILAATFIDKGSAPGIIAFPSQWRYTPDRAAGGFFLVTADLDPAGRADFAEQTKALTGLAQIALLQAAATQYLAAEISGRRYAVEIDLDGLSRESLLRCLQAAGYDAALARLKAAGAAKLEPGELKSTCLALHGFYEAVETALRSLPDADKTAAPRLRYPTAERSDCFRVKQLSQPALVQAALDAAEMLRTLDYPALARAARKIALPPAALVTLRSQWNAKDLPSLVGAETEKARSDQISKLKYTYTLYARVLACTQAFQEVSGPPFTEGQMAAFRRRMSALEAAYKSETNLNALWDEAMTEFPAMLSSTKYSIAVSPSSALDGCARNAGLFEIFSAKAVQRGAVPKKDF
ncbi:hypothetical protein [Aquabacter spiritensis]|uniref:Uncharacterized protein n=1 Tax=Aquabacter spiritensis TaxID=933073 RepID=A0A4R3LY59_9HYPH|nr:hypothetical protein [Aquabacter spiritensis]TCT05621.1 hypothetical protein EDC64_104178 [Aquabacter spiritensis]